MKVPSLKNIVGRLFRGGDGPTRPRSEDASREAPSDFRPGSAVASRGLDLSGRSVRSPPASPNLRGLLNLSDQEAVEFLLSQNGLPFNLHPSASPALVDAASRVREAVRQLVAAEAWQPGPDVEWAREDSIQGARSGLEEAAEGFNRAVDQVLHPPAPVVWDEEQENRQLRALLLDSHGHMNDEWRKRLACPAMIQILLERGGHAALIKKLISAHSTHTGDVQELWRDVARAYFSPLWGESEPAPSSMAASWEELPRWTGLSPEQLEHLLRTELFPQVQAAADNAKSATEERACGEYKLLMNLPGGSDDVRAADWRLGQAKDLLSSVPAKLARLEQQARDREAWLRWYSGDKRDDEALVQEASNRRSQGANFLLANRAEMLTWTDGLLRYSSHHNQVHYDSTVVHDSHPRQQVAGVLAALADIEEREAGKDLGHNFLKELAAREIRFHVACTTWDNSFLQTSAQRPRTDPRYVVFYDQGGKQICIMDASLQGHAHPQIPEGARKLEDLLQSRASMSQLLSVIRQVLDGPKVQDA